MKGLKKTPLFDLYERYGGKVIDFAGWALPVQFEGIIPEHKAVRQAAGIFDVSHMGEILVTGDGALRFLLRLLTLDVATLLDGRVGYGLMLNEKGGCVDDVLVYRYHASRFLLVVNASNRVKDYAWMQEAKSGCAIELMDQSDRYAQIALQGPSSEEILSRVCDLRGLKFFGFVDGVLIGGSLCLISRTGYTGEDGFELYVRPEDAIPVYEALYQAGEGLGLKAAGLGCRDTLRFEACLPLYGHELEEDITPLEAGLSKFVNLEKEGFIGREALVAQAEAGILRKLTGFSMIDRGVPRGGYEIWSKGHPIGYVTTGYYAPTLEQNLGLGLIESRFAAPGLEIDIMIRGKAHRAVTRDIPFYQKKYKR